MTESELQGGMRLLLEDAVVRARFRCAVDEVSPEERAAVLEELSAFLRGATEAASGYVRQALLLGEESVYRSMHAAPGVDHQMLDEAIEYAPKLRAEDR